MSNHYEEFSVRLRNFVQIWGKDLVFFIVIWAIKWEQQQTVNTNRITALERTAAEATGQGGTHIKMVIMGRVHLRMGLIHFVRKLLMFC